MTEDRDPNRTQDDGRRADESVMVRRTSTRRGALGGSAAVAVGAVAVAAGAALTACGGGKSSTSSESSAAGSSAEGTSAAATGAVSTVGSESGALSLQINGANHQISSSPDTMLLYVLRDEIGLKGPKFGCGLSQCGACAVLADGKQKPRTSPQSSSGDKATGRGFALVLRDGTYDAEVAEVEVDRATGQIMVTHVYVVEDHGLTVNPRACKLGIEAGITQSVSRTFLEQVDFDKSKVTSLTGVGEAHCNPLPAAVGDAVFDAIGVRNASPSDARRGGQEGNGLVSVGEPGVVSGSPTIGPRRRARGAFGCSLGASLGRGQVVRHRVLVP